MEGSHKVEKIPELIELTIEEALKGKALIIFLAP